MKFSALLGVTICLVIISACQKPPEEVEGVTGSVNDMKDIAAWIYTDPTTSCQYISFTGESGITPRLNASGDIICDNAKQTATQVSTSHN